MLFFVFEKIEKDITILFVMQFTKAFLRLSDCDVIVCACRTKGHSEKYPEKKAKNKNDYILWIGKSRISLWKGDKSQKEAALFQEQAVSYVFEMIYSALIMLLQM